MYAKQEKAIFSGMRWSLCEASTKSGKTVASIVRILEWGLFGNGRTKGPNGKVLPALPGQNYWWVAPVSNQARIAYNRVKLHLTPGIGSPKEHPEMHIQMATGPIISFKSADNPDSLYGEDVYGGIGDEASRQKDTAFHAFRSTLTATGGPAVFIGNVKGKNNWFYDWCRRAEAGKDPNASFERITWRDAVAAGVLDLEEIEDARRNLPEMVFRELYEAVASDDGGNPFGEDHIRACVIDSLSKNPPVAFGVDLAKSHDYLVIIGLDEYGQVCRFHRWTGVPWNQSIARIHDIVGDYIPCMVDSTGVGDPVLEQLQIDHGNFFGYTFSALSKQRLMEGLSVSIQSHEIGFPAGPIMDELMDFQYEVTRTGVRYSAPEGYYDDCVCALALARAKWAETAPGANLMTYWEHQMEARNRCQELENLGIPQGIGQEFVKLLMNQPDAESVLNNELADLYKSTVQGLSNPLQTLCVSCHKPITDGQRVSDGTFAWHVGCYGPGAQMNLRTIPGMKYN